MQSHKKAGKCEQGTCTGKSTTTPVGGKNLWSKSMSFYTCCMLVGTLTLLTPWSIVGI